MPTELTCGAHRAFIHKRGSAGPHIGELAPLSLTRWGRVRDEISRAEVIVPTAGCCDLLADIRCIKHELHIQRDGVTVWLGPIVRIEYEHDLVRVFAEDVLWQTKRAVINPGFDHLYPNPGWVLDTVDMLLRQAYERQGDPWQMLPNHIIPIRSRGEPKHYSRVNDYQMFIWEAVDKLAEDNGVDYTVINRDVYYWDVHWAWKILPELDDEFISEYPRIVEYGNTLATRCIVTNGSGFAAVDQVGLPMTHRNEYGFVDELINNANEGDVGKDPSTEELLEWQNDCLRALRDRAPAPLGVVVPDNATLMPGCPWSIDDLIPGAWFKVNVKRMCRKVSAWNRIQEISVEEAPPRGEVVTFTSITAPRDMHRPPL